MNIAEVRKVVGKLKSNLFRKANSHSIGMLKTNFKGTGLQFKEHQVYSHGDDIRFIDWNVSARFGHPFSKVFEEERELTVMLLIDVSASSLFGTINGTKRDIATEIAAVIAFSAVNNGDKVGVILYSDKIEKYIPPKKGKQQALYIVRELLSSEPKSSTTQLSAALKYFNNTTRQQSIAFILSDFIDANYQDALRISGNKHDVVGVKLYDKMDKTLPKVGMLCIEDLETGRQKWIDTNSSFVRYEYEKEFFRLTDYCIETFKRAGCSLLHVRTDEDYVKVLQRFFISRNK